MSTAFALLAPIASVRGSDDHPFSVFGPAYANFKMTLAPGERTEALGPLFSWESAGSSSLFAFSPLFSVYGDESIPQTEVELAYPIFSLDRFGKEYRLQFFQVLSWAGGESLKGGDKKRFTLFPIYFQQRGPDPEDNYTAVLPIYGRLKNRLFRDEVFFVLLPIYVQSTKRGIVTDNYLYPFFHVRHGPGLKGWQFWPVVGKERKEVTLTTNHWGDVSLVGGHEKRFVLWPFYFNNTLGIGTTNVEKQFVLIPFYTSQISTTRVTRTYGFPIGYTHTIDYERRYEEKGMPWPLIVFARGEGKTVNRVWPFFSQAKNPTLQSDFYLWPVYKYNRITAEPLDRERTRILFFLYSDVIERNTTGNTAFRRIDFWPLFTWRKDHKDNSRLQIFSILEPLLPNNKSIERVYSPVWSIYRQEKNAQTGASSKSLLWNLYRSEHRPDESKHSVLFGLFQREKFPDRTKWRLFFIPFSTTHALPPS